MAARLMRNGTIDLLVVYESHMISDYINQFLIREKEALRNSHAMCFIIIQ